MTPNLTLILLSGCLFGTGVYLLLSRSVVRALLGFVMIGNGVNLLFMIASGPAERPPFVESNQSGPMSDPIPQALVLTAIVISLAMTAFVLALAYRAWQLAHSDEVSDDEESARIWTKAEANQVDGPSADEEAGQIAAAFAAEEDE